MLLASLIRVPSITAAEADACAALFARHEFHLVVCGDYFTVTTRFGAVAKKRISNISGLRLPRFKLLHHIRLCNEEALHISI